MENELPILIDGEKKGSLRITGKGLMTEFTARCEPMDRVLRLSVYGDDGTEGRLGVMVPEDGVLKLHRLISRSAMAGFPEDPVEAGESGFPPALTAGSGDPETTPEAYPVDLTEDDNEQKANLTSDPVESVKSERDEVDQNPVQTLETPDITWFPVPMGSLVSVRNPALLAMPWQEGITYGQERLIEGRRYAVIRPEEIAIPAGE